ncbi:GerW family sporulation protein [Paenibacillus allorhizosphaerae]|uniref:Spore protein YtfJ n=1 Tax=Paenibacillus allorhizosphaerae TaxID=2849866 RepID=A0ABM8VHD3_9BACL|nr:GerW family sporulation protein [Paenibacillus allorhizosphaerae]CAG7641657.1 putative spore protein YtfJ [Paenibacillus allorhizosphaerae]
MTDHPIQGLMKTAMENIKEMVDVNTIVGDPVETPDGSVIMPISKVGFGFAAGGSEFVTDDTSVNGRNDAMNAQVHLPFGGGSGGGVSITPIAFLVVGKQGVKIVPLDNQTHLLERLIDSAPQVVDKIQTMMKGTMQSGTSGSTMGSTSGSGTQVTNNIENQNFIV